MPIQHQIVFYIPEDPHTWVDRMEAACRVLEQAFPGERMNLAHPFRESAPNVLLSDRRAYFKKALKTKMRRISIFNGKYLVGRGDTGLIDHGLITIGSKRDADAGHCWVSTIHPERPWETNEEVLVALGEALNAYTGILTPSDTFLRLRTLQYGHAKFEDVSWFRGNLPRLRYCMYGGLHSYEQPEIFGWLNYWSAATCRYVGFPDATRDQALLRDSREAPSGAWLVKLGAEPLDIRKPEHVRVLEAAYDRFPKVGVRL